MTPKTANTIFIICLLAGALVSGVGSSNQTTWLTYLGLAMMCIGLVIRVKFFRCPHCGGYLDRGRRQYCPYCGKNLNM